ncbi:hypothetical protein [Longimicrobium terrae]|uniref:Uncharacterized protein n=1 Tax=Longimicrobium terrae TaxID=1639882 RepID=A0A841H412_9BACT|nr:hypothetical protein [Longimicrobium terrae]MBB4638417.1 hypothetical protein [Longimicrobium terrae]MBB6072740.1 hypothetical protein [Longimicrobium terrae]NNC32386.1 hypothetical protein [Longimicrobium terrae]
MQPPESRHDPYGDREAAEREAGRAGLRRWMVALLACLLWCVAGGALTVYGFHMTDAENGPLLVQSGPWLAGAGVLITVLHALSRGRDAGAE